ncbi:MAG: hypothetical protein L3J70_02685 [Gammaproteobacteria bacterium]|nr:hypothetical protein [Gammaproteobacteria bacterium]
MLSQVIRSTPKLFSIIALSTTLAACDAEILEMANAFSGELHAALANNDRNLELSGAVGDAPVIEAEIIIKDALGETIVSTVSNNNAHYTANIPGGTSYPLTVHVNGGTDTVTNQTPGFEMVSIVENASQTTANINSFTTLITKSAEVMGGGLNLRNIKLAKLQITNSVNFGLDTAVMPDVVTSELTETNVASYVKSSVAMGEWLRRTHATLSAEGERWTKDRLVSVLSADLADGVLDGRQGERASDEIAAATANVLSAQVLIETLSQTLKVASVDVMASSL